MENLRTRELCLSLMRADTEAEVVGLLKDAGYWDNPAVWRYYGDNENNFSTIGNQQSRPDAALVEKLVNSVDARLMNECLARGIDPEGPKAPQTIRQAVAWFFEETPLPGSATAGLMTEWPDPKRTAIARGITLAATGATPREGNPSFIISDSGEGQTPEKMPETLLSLVIKSNKLRIPFVQGKFNMGGTGVLQFCGRHNLQLVVSRRNPAIAKGKFADPSDNQWGFSIVRRENPAGNRRSSVYTYLAPLGADRHPGHGGVLRFDADTMPIFPEGRDALVRQSAWGTLIKLLEYSVTGHKSHILMKDGILRRMDLLLPEVALPMRLHECRAGYKGHAGSPDTNLTGLGVRLEDGKAENLEFTPSSCPMSAAGEQMMATIYAFKKGRAETYRKNEGIIFIVNGQTHGHLTTDFFRRKQVGLSYLSDSILVTVDCSKFSGRAREDLFMNSRDRLRGGDLRAEIETALEDVLKHHQGLRDLKERRRHEEIESKLDDSKPLEDILKSLLQHSPTLAALFLRGKRVATAFKTIGVQGEPKPFEGRSFPTYFKFKGKEYGTRLHRDCHINMRCRVPFETDAVNDYFSREVDPGEFALYVVSGGSRLPVQDYTLNLQNGIASLSVKLPATCAAGDELSFVATVNDRSRLNPFENELTVHAKEPLEAGGGKGKRRKPPGEEDGGERELPSGIQLPKIIKVPESAWGEYNPPFDKYTALRIKHAGLQGQNGEDNEEGEDVYDFYLNIDNLYLNAELKSGSQDPEVTRARFMYGQVLLGLALLQHEAQAIKARAPNEENGGGEQTEDDNIEDRVELVSRAVAPVLLPMIDSLGSLDLEGGPGANFSGEAV